MYHCRKRKRLESKNLLNNEFQMALTPLSIGLRNGFGITCSKLIIETPEQGVKYVQS